MDPLVFRPLFMARPWGGRRLGERLGKPVPPGLPIGESWEVVDRADAQSVVRDGPLAGVALGELWRERRALFGRRGERSRAERFPLLVKLLDATETLSVQVHPPPGEAARLGGEPKSETWLFLDSDPGSHVFVGFREGATRAALEAALAAGDDLAPFLHRIDVAAGDSIHIPCGRIHAIGAGCLLFEVQQNSDTTYRVYDWNRPGLDGRPRELHVAESLASIDFDDVAPALDPPLADVPARTDWFTMRRRTLHAPLAVQEPGECALVAVLGGRARAGAVELATGEVALVPPDAPPLDAVGASADLLVIDLP